MLVLKDLFIFKHLYKHKNYQGSPSLKPFALLNSVELILFRILLLGSGQVGKSSLCAQFMSSDHVNTYLKVGEQNKNSLWS